MNFSKGKTRQNYEFKLQNKALEIVDSYSYLELVFACNTVNGLGQLFLYFHNPIFRIGKGKLVQPWHRKA
jgi:hypothetical protein